ncbi:MAG: hypothetical protein KDA80_12045 [Planctomycetaceae bacterium]|nr:hypothetical protein [Planctomycetaceae bacterium]
MDSTLIVGSAQDADPVEEIRMRTWARRNYAPIDERKNDWHPVILDEMRRKDGEDQPHSAK